MKLYENILETIGNTPLVRLNKIVPLNSAAVYVKLEYFNPGGSIKDRIAFEMIADAERNGKLKQGMTVVESSSGNTASGLAIACALKGYNLVVICDRYLPYTKRNRLLALGANIVFLPETGEGMDTVELRIRMANQLADELPNAITLNQYDNLVNRETHYAKTGMEIIRDTAGQIDAVVCAAGTTGTVTGVGKAMKAQLPNTKVVAVEPRGSTLFGGTPGPYFVQGTGLSFTPKNLDIRFIDKGVKVDDKDAFDTCRKLARLEGIFVGGSSGGVVFAGLQLAKEFGVGKTVVCVLPDGGDRYLDTVYSDKWLSSHDFKVPAKHNVVGLEKQVRKLGCTINTF